MIHQVLYIKKNLRHSAISTSKDIKIRQPGQELRGVLLWTRTCGHPVLFKNFIGSNFVSVMMQNCILFTTNPHLTTSVLRLPPMKVMPSLLLESSSKRHPCGINMLHTCLLKVMRCLGSLHWSFPGPGGVQGHHQLSWKLCQISSSPKSRELNKLQRRVL